MAGSSQQRFLGLRIPSSPDSYKKIDNSLRIVKIPKREATRSWRSLDSFVRNDPACLFAFLGFMACVVKLSLIHATTCDLHTQ